jgi:hypothetical protein
MKDTRDQLDLLLHIEKLTEELNRRMSTHSRFVLRRYPLTFAIVALFGVVAVSEGVKGVMAETGLLDVEPLHLLLLGILILVVLGSVYRKLDK